MCVHVRACVSLCVCQYVPGIRGLGRVMAGENLSFVCVGSVFFLLHSTRRHGGLLELGNYGSIYKHCCNYIKHKAVLLNAA